jgi:arginine N-succinyltransferase
MFVIRPAQPKDLPTLLKLARMVHFINLPADHDLLSAKIKRSLASFAGKAKSERERQFMFVLEDTETENVVGTSAVISCISWPGSPHVFFRVGRRELFSRDLQGGQVHVTLTFDTDETGPSEMGGLVLAPGYRGHKDRLGSLLSLVRFHYIGLHRERFAQRILAELMGTVTTDSRTPLWEYLGSRFINLSYREADLFSARSKEFMTSLFPREELFATLLPPEARALIGKVGEETEPAKAMLERQGFRSKGHVDPFDGGPYLEADRDAIPLVKATRSLTLAGSLARGGSEMFVSFETKDDFRALRCQGSIEGDSVRIPAEAIRELGAKEGQRIGVTPLAAVSKGRKKAATGATRGRKA